MSSAKAGVGIEAVLEEHRQLRQSLAQLREYLKQPGPAAGAAGASTWAGTLSERLVDFRDRAQRHFRTEEQTDFMDQLARSAPRATRTIARLQSEHDRILGELRTVLESAAKYSRRDVPASELRERALAVLDSFELHEQNENDLIQGLICDDLGAGD